MRYAAVVLFLCIGALAFTQQGDEAARDMAEGAEHFLASLESEQRAKAEIAFGDEERYNFHYIPRERKGLPYKELTPGQRKTANAFLATGLSASGTRKALEIMYLDQILLEMERRDIRDPDAYFFTVFGRPADAGAWGWRVEGHHLSLNFTLHDGRVVSTSPSFFGANPAVVPEGSHRGMAVLRDEEGLGRALYLSLDDRKKALIEAEAPRDIVTAASRRAEIGRPVGVRLGEMPQAQRDAALALVRIYANRMRAELASSEMARIDRAGVDEIRFAWAGGDEKGEPHYYRIHGPTFLIEYDNTQNGANHIHTVWRDLTGDFGDVDPLSDHYAKSPHHRREHPHVHAVAEP